MDKTGYVYVMASGRNGTLYIGVTSDFRSVPTNLAAA
jgi:predicted GIY-YIG superfamily endonuclease